MTNLHITLERKSYVKAVDIFTTIEVSAFAENQKQIDYIIEEIFTASTEMITVTEMLENRMQELGRLTFHSEGGKFSIEYRPFYLATQTYAHTRTVPFDTMAEVEAELKKYIGHWLGNFRSVEK